MALTRSGGHHTPEKRAFKGIQMNLKKSKKPVRRQSPEFKAEVVALIRNGGKTVSETARDFGLADSLIRGWIAQSETSGAVPVMPTLSASEKEEHAHLRREVKTLCMEREILKRAATFFAKENA